MIEIMQSVKDGAFMWDMGISINLRPEAEFEILFTGISVTDIKLIKINVRLWSV